MKESTCQFCKFANRLPGLPAPLLICDHSPTPAKSYRLTPPDASCPHWQPHPSLPLDFADIPDDAHRLIPLTQGKFAIVDAADYPALIRYKWTVLAAPNTFYAVRSEGKTQIRMHRQILNAPPHLVVDHINHNGLNNARKNIRLCTRAQNNRNQHSHKNSSSKYKGVTWSKKDKTWFARIHKNKKTYYLGFFKKETDATRAYDKKAKKLFGQFAYLNFSP